MAAVLGASVAAPAAFAEDEEREFPPLAEAVEGYQAIDGFFRLYRKPKEERLLAAIPEALLGEPLFLATSVAGGSEYAGWQWEDKLMRLERWGKKLLLVELNTRQRAAKDEPLEEVVRRTYADRLLADLEIEGRGEDGELLVDLGELLSNGFRTFFGASFSLDSTLAQFSSVKAFPNNVEVGVTMPLFGDGTFVTLHYSISGLPPLEDYTARLADERIGYFLTAIRDYTAGDPEDGRMVRLINRWKLEKADPDLALSPPKEPIVFYIENTVPIAYRRAVAAGILEWNKAFEEIGITGAIVVRQQTDTQFADIDPEDVRYNFFRWITSETPFAMGPSRVDPRTGRILDADIIFDDSMLRGYLHEYDVLIRDAPSKMLTRPMQDLLERRPELHPLARFARQEGSLRSDRVSALLRELEGEHGLSLRAILEGAAGEERIVRRDDLAQLPERVRRSAVCRLGELLPQQVGLAQLAIGGLARVGPSGAPLGGYLTQVVKETVMHEVGHTLGLRHNFKASSMLSLDQINSPDKPAATSASVMDYHPINLSSDPDKQGNFLPRTIGPYDYLAIEYGYKLCAEDDEALAAVPERMAAEGIPYATDEDVGSPDPLITRWDMGDDPLAYARDRVALVQVLWQDLEDRAVDEGESYSRLRRALNVTLFEVQQAAVMTSRLVGGMSFSRDHRGDPHARPPIAVVDAAKQRAALAWLGEQIFAGKALQVPPQLQSKLAAGRWVHWGSSDGGATLDYSVMDRLLQIQTWALFFITADDVLARIWENERRAKISGGAAPLTLPELFDTIEASLFGELEQLGTGGQPTATDPVISSVRQNLQDAYVRRLIQIAIGDGLSPPVANKLAWSRLRDLERKFQPVLTGARLDPYTRAHLEVLMAKSEAARAPDYVHIASGGCALAPRAVSPPWLPLGLVGLGLAGLLIRRRRAA